MINKVHTVCSLIMIHNEVTLAVRHLKGCRNTARSEWTFGKRAAARNGLLVKRAAARTVLARPEDLML